VINKERIINSLIKSDRKEQPRAYPRRRRRRWRRRRRRRRRQRIKYLCDKIIILGAKIFAEQMLIGHTRPAAENICSTYAIVFTLRPCRCDVKCRRGFEKRRVLNCRRSAICHFIARDPFQRLDVSTRGSRPLFFLFFFYRSSLIFRTKHRISS